MGIGLLFGSQAQASAPIPQSASSAFRSKSNVKGKGRAAKSTIPNPYAPSSSESDEELEPDLEEVETIRRSLVRQPPGSGSSKQVQRRVSDRSKKGWLAHQSIFPPSSSSSSSETDESEKQTEEDSEDERMAMMGRSRKARSTPRTRGTIEEEEEEDDAEGYDLSPSELYQANKQVEREDLEAPLLGPDELERTRGVKGKVPIRLQVYHGRFGHWEREGLRKYKDSAFLAMWLTSILGVLIGLIFVWGSTDVSAGGIYAQVPTADHIVATRRGASEKHTIHHTPATAPIGPPNPLPRPSRSVSLPTPEDRSTCPSRYGSIDPVFPVRLRVVGDRSEFRFDWVG